MLTKAEDSAIQQLLSDVFEAAFDPDICGFGKYEFAKKAKMSYGYSLRLRQGKARNPSYAMVIRMCKVVKMDLREAKDQLYTPRIRTR